MELWWICKSLPYLITLNKLEVGFSLTDGANKNYSVFLLFKGEGFMNEKEYIESQNDCAKLLGQSFSEYNKSLEKIKCSYFEKPTSKGDKVKNILTQLGLTEKDLKKI